MLEQENWEGEVVDVINGADLGQGTVPPSEYETVRTLGKLEDTDLGLLDSGLSESLGIE
jgi:hypothetical protein